MTTDSWLYPLNFSRVKLFICSLKRHLRGELQAWREREGEWQGFACKWGSRLENTARLMEGTQHQSSTQRVLDERRVPQRFWFLLEMIIQAVTSLKSINHHAGIKMATVQRWSCKTSTCTLTLCNRSRGQNKSLYTPSLLWFTVSWQAAV